MIRLFFAGILILLFSSNTFAQVKIANERIENGNMYLEMELNIAYVIAKQNGIDLIKFISVTDESRPGEFSLPQKNIIVAIPAGTKPGLTWQILNEENISATPELNPLVSVREDKAVYNKSNFPVLSEKQELLEVAGYLWAGDNYCVNIRINPVWFDNSTISTRIVQKLKIILNDPSVALLKKQDKENSSLSSIIINKITAQNFVTDRPRVNSENDNWIDFSKSYIKLGVSEDGIYRISYDYLLHNGINIHSVNPQTFKLYLKGAQVQIYVSGEEDYSFDKNDFIEFVGRRNYDGNHRAVSAYGEPYNEYLNRYSDESVYWLTWDGEKGLRASVKNSDSEISPDINTEYYYKVEHFEENKWFDSPMALARQELPFWTENKTWHEFSFGVGTADINFTLSGLYSQAESRIFVKLLDYSSSIPVNAHRVDLGINEHAELYSSTVIDKYETVVLSAAIPTSKLTDGTNVLHINSYQTENTLNKCIFDWFELEYPKQMVYENEGLVMSFPHTGQNKVVGFRMENNGINDKVFWKLGTAVVKYFTSYNNSKIIFADSLNSTDMLFLVSDQLIKEPDFYYQKQFTNLEESPSQIDYILITSPMFSEQAGNYIRFLAESYGISPIVIDVNDVYDQYAYGCFNPEAIKDFLFAAKNNWPEPAPQNVFLVGSANYDYYGNKAKYFGVNFVPNHVPSFGIPVSDSWYVTFDTTGAYIPEYNIGRLPVQTADEFDWYLQKHISYKAQPADDWNKTFLFFSGGNDGDAEQQKVLKNVNDEIISGQISAAPLFGRYSHFYKTENPFTNFGPYTKNEIDSAIENGGVFISYLGHSGTRIWDNSIIEPSQLSNNRNRYPLITDFGCSTGRFAEPDVISFSQLFTLSPEGQAILYIGNASLGFISTATAVPGIFYNNVISGGVRHISEALKQAKLNLLENNANDIQKIFTLTNTLIGDPIISLPLPEKPNLHIAVKDVSVDSENPDDGMEYIKLIAEYYNYGLKLADSLDIKAEHIYNGEVVESIIKKVNCPEFKNILELPLNIKNRSGLNTIRIILDPQNNIEEIAEDDNLSEYTFNVYSSGLRPILSYRYENSDDKIVLLNSVSKPETENFIVQVSGQPNFVSPWEKTLPFDTYRTVFSLSEFGLSIKKWARWKLEHEKDFGAARGIFVDNKNKFFVYDSAGFNNFEKSHIKISQNSISLDSVTAKFEVLSAGFNDGNFAVVKKDDINHVPINEGGHHVCLFDKYSLEFKEYKKFDVYNGGNEAENNYKTFIDTLGQDYYIMIAVADEGRINSPELRNSLKAIGSRYIDSLVFRSSWAIIGFKGAQPGSVKEAYSKPTGGSINLQQTFSYLSSKGSFATPLIGPAAKWNSLSLEYEKPEGTVFNLRAVGIKNNGDADTLDYFSTTGTTADLNELNNNAYPYIKLLGELESKNQATPQIKSIGVNYNKSPELGTNYQVVSVSTDSVDQGKDISLLFQVWNADETAAEKFSVRLNLLNSINTKKLLLDTTINSLAPDTFTNIKYDYSTNARDGYGNQRFEIIIDSNNDIPELYEDNNYYTIPFYVIKDSVTNYNSALVNVLFDGRKVFNGDFVNPEADVLISINYNQIFPADDSSKIEFYLDRDKLPYNSFLALNDIEKGSIEYKYKGRFTDGNHIFEVRGDNLIGNRELHDGYEVEFSVADKTDIVDVFNYPNPFSTETYFTFRLPTIPEKLMIKIYTVAGRLIKNIEVPASELNVGFNKIWWNGYDEDGDIISNGVYLYKSIIERNGESSSIIQKLSVFR